MITNNEFSINKAIDEIVVEVCEHIKEEMKNKKSNDVEVALMIQALVQLIKAKGVNENYFV